MFQKGNKYGNRFDSENQPAKNGRKPSLYKVLKNITGKKVGFEMEKEDYYAVIRWVMEQTPKQLKDLLKKDAKGDMVNDVPLWLINIISALNTDAKYGKTATVEMIFDRIFGKATTVVEGDLNASLTSTTNMDLSALSTDELLTYNQLLDKINNRSK